MKITDQPLRGRSRIVCCLMILFTGTVTGCTDADFKRTITGRWGPDPALNPVEVNNVIRSQTQVLLYIENGAGLLDKDGQRASEVPATQYWYTVAQWGFNVGRQDCEIYLNTLYRMNREKQRNDSALAALAAGTAAILTPAHASAKSLSIVAAAFGLTTAINDAVFASYLFTEAPGLISNKVKDLQDAYQKQLTPASITSGNQAYSAIQHYYAICLPESIEGVLLEAVANTTATVKTGGQNGKDAKDIVPASPKLVTAKK